VDIDEKFKTLDPAVRARLKEIFNKNKKPNAVKEEPVVASPAVGEKVEL
jgi:hypothetical protein